MILYIQNTNTNFSSVKFNLIEVKTMCVQTCAVAQALWASILQRAIKGNCLWLSSTEALTVDLLSNPGDRRCHGSGRNSNMGWECQCSRRVLLSQDIPSICPPLSLSQFCWWCLGFSHMGHTGMASCYPPPHWQKKVGIIWFNTNLMPLTTVQQLNLSDKEPYKSVLISFG